MRKVDEFWAAFFGLAGAVFLDAEPKVVPHAGLQGYQGAWLFRHHSSYIASVPPHWLEVVQSSMRCNSPSALTDKDFVAIFGDAVDKTIGPAYQGYLEKENFRSSASSARLLSPQDAGALRDLSAACDADEWEHSSIVIEQLPNFGSFADNKLVAASNYQMWSEGAAMPGFITHPHYRGQGYGKSVLSAATEHASNAGFLMLYQTLVANKPAICAAESLGYKPYATHLALRLKA